MTRLLDTNICIAFLNGDDAVLQNLRSSDPDEIVVCSVVKAELYYGARKSQKVEANLHRLREFFSPFESLSFDDSAAEAYGLLRAQLARGGALIGANDLMIAAIALTADVTVVTRNLHEFTRVPGLRVETW